LIRADALTAQHPHLFAIMMSHEPPHDRPASPRRRAPAALAVVLALVSGQNEGGLMVPATPMAGLQNAASCVVNLPWFGHQQGTYGAPLGTIAMSNDGGWCALQFVQIFGKLYIQPEISVVVQPNHGEVMATRLADRLAVTYRPTPGFVGTDHFTARTDGPIPHTIPFDVTVK
jgi:hypothetical protein